MERAPPTLRGARAPLEVERLNLEGRSRAGCARRSARARRRASGGEEPAGRASRDGRASVIHVT
eukprot:3398615-Prymnesium_polylepis.1